MNAYTFRRHDSKRGVVTGNNTSNKRTLYFRDSRIIPSILLANELGVKAGSHLAFTYDEDNPENVYVRTADDADDTKDIQCSLHGAKPGSKTLRCKNRAVVMHILSQVGAKASCTCYVSPTPTNINGKEHYQILLSCPIQIN